MNTKQIENILGQELGEVFVGVFSRDNIPTHLPNKFAMVVNTHPSHKPGEHWVAFYVDRMEGEYFDSYGLPPPPDFERLLDKYSVSQHYNTHQLQDYFSFVCGQYCIYYLYHRYHGEGLGDICNRLRSCGDRNDSLVADFVAEKWDIEEVNWGQTCGCFRDFVH